MYVAEWYGVKWAVRTHAVNDKVAVIDKYDVVLYSVLKQ